MFVRRRRALARGLGEVPALIFAGGMRPKNYPANPFPYRADSHFLYLTGAGIPDAALLLHDGRAELFVPAKDEDDALWHGHTPSRDDLREALGTDTVRTLDELPDALSRIDATKVATLPSADRTTRLHQSQLLGERPWARPGATDELSSLDGALADAMIDLRLIHDAAAIEQLERAAEATAAAHRAGMAVSRSGIREHQVRAAMEAEITARGMTTSYPPIVTTRGEVLHNDVHPYTLAEGDLLLADVGADAQGWAGDVTRTWPVSGRYSPTQRTMYELVLAAEKIGVDMVRPGVRYRDIHLACARVLTRGLVDEGILKGDPDGLVERGAHALFFPHGVGHIIGLDVHDMEDLGDRAGYPEGRRRADQFGLGFLRLDRDLEAGMMVTIEPGFYRVPAILERESLSGRFVTDGSLDLEALERFSDVRGIRIEDDVLCTAQGPRVMSAEVPKEVDDVEALVGTAPHVVG